jgi:RHS repeat-associated protein
MKTLSYRIAIFWVVLSLLAGPVAPVFAQEGTPGTPTAVPVEEEETPTVTPTETALPLETALPTETPTAAVTETASVTPTVEVPQIMPMLSLRTDPAFLTNVQTVNLFWSLEGISLGSSSLVLQISLPEGFEAQHGSGVFDEATRLLSIPVTDLSGSLELKVKKVNTDSIFSATVSNENEILAAASIILPLSEQVEVGQGGGKIDVLKGKVKVTFPEGALQEDVILQAGFPSADALPENYSAHVFELRAFANGSAARGEGLQGEQTEITQFDQPLTIEVDYSDLTLTEEQEQELFLYWYNEETGDWHALESYRDTETKTLTAKSDHFTVFDVGVNDWDSTRLPTIDPFQVSEFTGAATFSLPLEVPPGPGGFQPDLTLSYNSQVVDQATTKAQASWVGMGWSLDSGGTITNSGVAHGFMLTVNGMSTHIVREELYGEYHLEDENFWKVEFLNSDQVNSYWVLYDTQGTKYVFENIINPFAFWQTAYQWHLTRVINTFGKEINYTYAFETKTVYDETVVTATYLDSILYAGGRYRVRFTRTARNDYTAAWATDQAFHIFERTRLNTVIIDGDADGNGTFDTIRRYAFTYVDPAVNLENNIWPGVTYSAGGKALTLASVYEIGGTGVGTALPGHTFTYEDNLHLTAVTNGYGGGVVFDYEDDAWFYGPTPSFYKRENIAACQGIAIADGWIAMNGTAAVNCSTYTPWMALTDGRVRNYLHTNHPLYVEYNIMRPGGVYRVNYTAATVSGGSSYWAGLFTQSGDADNAQTISTSGGKIQLTAYAKTVDLFFKAVGTAKLLNMGVALLPSFYRVSTKTITDGNGHSYEYSYAYESPSATINQEEVEFRGHGTVGVTHPDGTYTETTYLQGEYDKGRVDESCTYETAPSEPGVYGQKISCVDNDYTVIPLPAVDPAGVIDHAWVSLAAQTNRTYNVNGGPAGGTKTLYSYDSNYGNLIEKQEFDVPNSTGTPYRVTEFEYYPNAGSGVNLISLPAHQKVTSGSGIILSQVRYYYNGSNNHQSPPTANKLTKTRTMVENAQYMQTDYGYNPYGNQTSVTNYTGYSNGSSTPSGPLTTFTYYDQYFHVYPTRFVNALGQETTLAYDYVMGLPIRQTDPNGAVTKVTYDLFGRVTNLYKPDPTSGAAQTTASLTMSYNDAFPFSTTITQALPTGSYSVTKTYDGMGRVTQVNAGGVITETFYDSSTVTRQRVPYEVDAPIIPDLFTTTTIDIDIRTTTVGAPDETQTVTRTNGLLTSFTDARGNITITTNDIWGRTVAVNAPIGPDISYTYDEMDRLKTVVRGPSSTVSLTYNKAGQKTGMVDPDMGTWSYTYDGLGNLKTQTDARGCLLTMDYDPLNRLKNKFSLETGCGTQINTSYYYDSDDPSTSSYDPLLSNQYGYRTHMTSGPSSGSGQATDSWTYDKRGRVLSATNQGYTTNYTYNNADQLLTMTYPDGEVVTHSYTSRMQLSTLSGTQSSATTNYLTSAVYDAAGRIELMTFGNNTQTDYVYNTWSTEGGRLQQLKSGTASVPNSLQGLSYTYDPAGNIATITEDSIHNSGQKQCFTYDALDRLVKATTSTDASQGCSTQLGLGNYDETYDYDITTGNLASKGSTTNILSYNETVSCAAGSRTIPHAVSSLNGNTFEYDCNGNQTTRVIGADTFNLSYDAENRLVKVEKGISPPTTIAEFTYDGDGKRVQATENGVTTLFIGGHYEVTGSQITKYYFAGTQRIAVRKYTIPSSSSSVEYLLSDHLGSTSMNTDASGAKVSEMRYTPWGEVRSHWTASASISLADYTFTGQYSYMDDPSTSGVTEGFGLMFYNARWYDPQLGRFAQADSIVPQSQGVQAWDRYAYVNNSPINYSDPSGHDWKCTGANEDHCYEDGKGTRSGMALPTSEYLNEIASKYNIHLSPSDGTNWIYNDSDKMKLSEYDELSDTDYGYTPHGSITDNFYNEDGEYFEPDSNSVVIFKRTFTECQDDDLCIAGVLAHEATHSWAEWLIDTKTDLPRTAQVPAEELIADQVGLEVSPNNPIITEVQSRVHMGNCPACADPLKVWNDYYDIDEIYNISNLVFGR